MKIVWSPQTIQGLISLRAHIAEGSPAGARRIVLRIRRDYDEVRNQAIGRVIDDIL